MKYLALAAVLAMGGEAIASETSLVISGISYHFERAKKYNEQNFGLGLEHRLSENWRAGAGWYRNSFYRTSWYAGATYAPLAIGPVRLGMSLGVVTGYYKDPDRVLPMVVPTLSVEGGGWGANMVVMPPSKQTGGGGIAMQLKRAF